LWVPAPVRNGALGRDDRLEDALASRFRKSKSNLPLSSKPMARGRG
jgi:hypothetical protein